MAFAGGYWLAQNYRVDSQTLLAPVNPPEPKPLLEYTIPTLRQRQYSASHLTLEKVLTAAPNYTSYTFAFNTLGKRMTGVINVPTVAPPASTSAIVMLRGYVPPANYQPGVGTKNAAAVLATEGYITVAPDFFGYGESDPEFSDPWLSRFSKPVEVIELLKTLTGEPVVIPTGLEDQPPTAITGPIRMNQIGLWGHSNGGQIALSVLEILGSSIPTTIWAPVTAPFPYSILFFSDEELDEGKSARWELAKFEKIYDVFDFTVTQHLDLLQAPLLIHHGIADDTAPVAWSDEFVARLKAENERRSASQLPLIDYQYFRYPGADHNLQPGWDTVVSRDLKFFGEQFSK